MSKIFQHILDFFGEFVVYSFLILLGLSIGITALIALVMFLV